MKRSRFEKPVCEVVRFANNVIVTSGCGCYMPGLGDVGTDCTGDGPPACACTVNYDPAVANCITP